MSLANQTCWVVGGVGVVGRGITRGLLQAGATVIVNSRSAERLENLSETLDHPERLVTVHGSLLPGFAEKTASDTLSGAGGNGLNHVVAHGAVRWWARPTPGHYVGYEYRAGCDETYSLDIRAGERILDMTCEEFSTSSARLAALHFSAARALMPRLRDASANSPVRSTYTFVTGDGSGKPGGGRTAMGEINSHHVWGLSAALRSELAEEAASHAAAGSIACREIRVGLPVHGTDGDDGAAGPTDRPISEDVGDLCAGLAAAPDRPGDNGRLIRLEEYGQLESLLREYNVAVDGNVGSLPHYLCEQGEIGGSA